MEYLNNLNTKLSELHLLKHPFYKAWSDGALTISKLQFYAMEYYHHVAAFPRYISQIHSLCTDIKSRQILLDNLIDEEKGEDNHPELWIRFTKGIGVINDDFMEESKINFTQKLVYGFFDLVKTDYATGLGALYSYERQSPEVSKSKIEGLKNFYNITNQKTLQFFLVHQQSDEWHTEELINLIKMLNQDDKEKVYKGAITGAKLLWEFLDGVNSYAN